MKQIIILFFAFISSLSAYCQVSDLEEGNQCFSQGDYTCAEAKYKEVFKSAVGKEKQIAEIKIQRVKRCIENLKIADLAFNSKNYTKAKENYNSVLDSNPNDNYVKGQLDKINIIIIESTIKKLTVSKTQISFKSSGGSDNITINTNSNLYTIDLLPNWCSVQKYDSYIVINCTNNYKNTARNDYFNVKAGDKTIRVNISQEGVAQKIESSLSLSKISLSFPKEGGDENITVITNASDFSVIFLPTWCTIKKFKDYITVTCLSNKDTQSRSDWFKIFVENKDIKVAINQSGAKENGPIEVPDPPIEKLKSFSSLGFQSGEIAKYGLLYESGGKKTVGFHFSARTSNTPKEDILKGTGIKNKTEIDLGPNFKIFNRLYWNIGVGYGYYDKSLRNDYAHTLKIEKTGYLLATSGLMIRISRVININGGVSFIDIDKDFYKPEITFGISFNLKGKYRY
jgi:hypothetical protein